MGEHAERRGGAGSGAQHLRRSGRGRSGGRHPQRDPARGRQHVQRHVLRQRRERRDAGEQLHRLAEGPGPQGAVRTPQALRDQSDGRRPDRPGQAVVLHVVPPHLDGQHRPRHVRQQERRQPERLDRGFRPEPAGVFRNAGSHPDRARHVAGHAAQQAQFQLAGADLSPELERRRHRDDDDRSDEPRLVRAVTAAGHHLVVADYEPVAGGGRLGHVSVALPQSRAAHRRDPSTPG